jgi:hypothetical protein
MHAENTGRQVHTEETEKLIYSHRGQQQTGQIQTEDAADWADSHGGHSRLGRLTQKIQQAGQIHTEDTAN